MELAAERTDQLREPPLDRHVDVLVVVRELEAAPLELAGDPVEPLRNLPDLRVVEHTELRECSGVRLRLLDIELRKAPVERDRGVDPPEEGILLFAESVHGG